METQIRIMEADRKVEWDALERVICLLLTWSVDEDGSSVETANAIDNCQTEDVDTSHRDIEYPTPPALRDLPALPRSPCSDEFENDAYNGVPPGCSGNEELQQEFEHGLITECECSAEPPQVREVGFPYSLGPFLMFDTGFALNSLTVKHKDFCSLRNSTPVWHCSLPVRTVRVHFSFEYRSFILRKMSLKQRLHLPKKISLLLVQLQWGAECEFDSTLFYSYIVSSGCTFE